MQNLLSTKSVLGKMSPLLGTTKVGVYNGIFSPKCSYGFLWYFRHLLPARKQNPSESLQNIPGPRTMDPGCHTLSFPLAVTASCRISPPSPTPKWALLDLESKGVIRKYNNRHQPRHKICWSQPIFCWTNPALISLLETHPKDFWELNSAAV